MFSSPRAKRKNNKLYPNEVQILTEPKSHLTKTKKKHIWVLVEDIYWYDDSKKKKSKVAEDVVVQEAQEKLKDWVKDVQKKRMNGESDYGKDVDSTRFSDLFESTIKNFKVLTFKEAFMESLRKDCET
jgi:hypothetical protein